jgi:Cu2+-exporting ATPase
MSTAFAPLTDPLVQNASAAAVVDDPLEFERFSQQGVDGRGQPVCTSGLQVSGITCAACSGILEAALMRVDGVLEAQVSAAGHRASVRWDPALTQPSALIDAIRGAGYDAVPDAGAPARDLRRHEHRRALWRVFVASFCAMQVMMLATPSYVAVGNDLAPDLRSLLNWGQWLLTLPVVLFAAGPFFSNAWRSLRLRRISMDVPVALGIGVASAASMGATFAPGGLFGSEVYYDSVTMFVSFLLGARYLELRARHRAQAELEAALAGMPPTACRETPGGALETVSLRRLVPGDRLRVALGDAFPADGQVLDGQTQADEALLTGESTPVPKRAGDTVVAGSVNVGAPVRMLVERVGEDTRFEAIVSMMRGAMSQRPASAQLADRWAGPFLWAVLLLAAGSAAAWTLVDPAMALPVAVAVLVVTCPCALSLAAPSALVAAAGGLARRGVLVQRLDAIEGLARADRLFVDKTGTLTDERLVVDDLRLAPGSDVTAADLWPLAAALARWSSHPVAKAIGAAADGRPEASGLAASMHDVVEHPGLGLGGRDAQGRYWQLGSAGWLSADPAFAAGARSVLACDGRVVAAFDLHEALRPGVIEALDALRAEGLAPTLLSGDDPVHVLALAQRVGITDAHGSASPQDKLDAVAAAQALGQRVVMVGDGINDAPVLARADVSLAMGQGALVTRGQADAVVVSGRWTDVLRARATARRTMGIVRQNLIWAVLYNAACLPLAVAGWLPPWAAGLGMALSSLAVVLNALRAGHESP